MISEAAIRELCRAHRLLNASVEAFTSRIGPVLYIPEGGLSRFELAHKTAENLQILMAVRVCTGLGSAMVLLSDGFINEIGVLMRTVSDFLLTIAFLEDGLEAEQPNKAFVDFVKDYFSQPVRSTEDLRTGSSKTPFLPARKKRAGEVRLLGPYGNPDGIRRMLEADEEVLSGYVHGCYRQVMELYKGSRRSGEEGFLLRGARGTPHIKAWRDQIALKTHRALNMFADMARRLGLDEFFGTLIAERERFEKGPAYPY